MLRDNIQRAKNAIIILYVIVLINVVSAISSVFQYLLVKAVDNGENISMETLEANDTRERIIGIVYILIFIVCGILFIQWFRRAYNNLHQMSRSLQYTEGWAAGSWFVPILNLFRPVQIMQEMYKETYRILSDRGIELRMLAGRGWIGAWWTSWIILEIMSRVSLQFSKRADTIDDILDMTVFQFASCVAGIVAALLAAKIVRDYAEAEPMLMEISNEPEPVPLIEADNHLEGTDTISPTHADTTEATEPKPE